MNHIPLQVAPEVLETVAEMKGQVEDQVSETEDQETETTPQDGEGADEDAEGGSGGENTSSGRPGIDTVLREVREQLGDNAYEVVRGMQRDFVQGNQNESLQRQLRDSIAEVEALRDEVTAEMDAEPDPVAENLANVDPAQIELLDAYLRTNGYVRQDELDEMARSEQVTETNKAAVARFGDDFGSLDGDTFNINQTAKDNMQPYYNRLVNEQNLTFEDLYKLSHFDALISSASQQGRNEAVKEFKANNGQRVRQAINGTVGMRNAGGETSPDLYNPDDYKEVSKPKGFARISDVMSKARRAAETSINR